METLLSLTSKRAGEWFKEELRVLGGIDHIVRTIKDCVRKLAPPVANWDTTDVDVLRKADRCMRVLENVSTAVIINSFDVPTEGHGFLPQKREDVVKPPIRPLINLTTVILRRWAGTNFAMQLRNGQSHS